MRIVAVRARDPATIAARAAEVAQWAAAHATPTVFRSPVATFASADSASMDNMANGIAITLDVDNADPREALRVLRAVHGLGEPTVVTMTGSVWECPAAHEPVPKRHFHWRLSAPTTTPAEHDRLRGARRLAAELGGADRGLAPPVHPIRWPGSPPMTAPIPFIAPTTRAPSLTTPATARANPLTVRAAALTASRPTRNGFATARP